MESGSISKIRKASLVTGGNRAVSVSLAMSLIHPSQIDPINQMFSPTSEEIDYAQRVIQAFEEANARGDGSIAFGGQLIDRTDRRARARRALEFGQITRNSLD